MRIKILFTFLGAVFGLILSISAFAAPEDSLDKKPCIAQPTTPASEPCPDRARNLTKKNATGTTLFVEGQADRDIYDYLKMDPSINRIEFNSYGGMELHSEIIAREIRKRHITTSVREGARCASMCALLYQAGEKREAHETAWFGYHGQQIIRLHQEYQVRCIEVGNKAKKMREQECRSFEVNWIAQCRERTDIYHGLIEEFGASPSLYSDFKSRPHDPDWAEDGNCATVMPWKMQAIEAVKYNIVTDLKK